MRGHTDPGDNLRKSIQECLSRSRFRHPRRSCKLRHICVNRARIHHERNATPCKLYCEGLAGSIVQLSVNNSTVGRVGRQP